MAMQSSFAIISNTHVSMVPNNLELIHHNQRHGLANDDAIISALMMVLLEQVSEEQTSSTMKLETLQLTCSLIDNLESHVDVNILLRTQAQLLLCIVYRMSLCEQSESIVNLLTIIPKNFNNSNCLFMKLCHDAIHAFARTKLSEMYLLQ